MEYVFVSSIIAGIIGCSFIFARKLVDNIGTFIRIGIFFGIVLGIAKIVGTFVG